MLKRSSLPVGAKGRDFARDICEKLHYVARDPSAATLCQDDKIAEKNILDNCYIIAVEKVKADLAVSLYGWSI